MRWFARLAWYNRMFRLASAGQRRLEVIGRFGAHIESRASRFQRFGKASELPYPADVIRTALVDQLRFRLMVGRGEPGPDVLAAGIVMLANFLPDDEGALLERFFNLAHQYPAPRGFERASEDLCEALSPNSAKLMAEHLAEVGHFFGSPADAKHFDAILERHRLASQEAAALVQSIRDDVSAARVRSGMM